MARGDELRARQRAIGECREDGLLVEGGVVDLAREADVEPFAHRALQLAALDARGEECDVFVEIAVRVGGHRQGPQAQILDRGVVALGE